MREDKGDEGIETQHRQLAEYMIQRGLAQALVVMSAIDVDADFCRMTICRPAVEVFQAHPAGEFMILFN